MNNTHHEELLELRQFDSVEGQGTTQKPGEVQKENHELAPSNGTTHLERGGYDLTRLRKETTPCGPGPHGAQKMHKKGSHFIKKLRFLMFLTFPRFLFLGVISGNVNPPGDTGDKSRVFGNPDFCKKSRF